MACAENNTIILTHSVRNFTESEVKHGRVTIDECFCDADERKRWSIADEEAARAELAKHKCTFSYGYGTVWTDVWALEFWEADEDGEFINGGDSDYAPLEFGGDRFYTVAFDGGKLTLVETEVD